MGLSHRRRATVINPVTEHHIRFPSVSHFILFHYYRIPAGRPSIKTESDLVSIGINTVMAGLSFVTIMRKANSLGKVPGNADTRTWFREQARKVVSINNNKLLQDPNVASSLEPGNMYFFAYDAKWKDKLPYWDAFPLIFPFKVEGNRVWGLNLHYLPFDLRAELMDALHGTVDKRYKNENRRLRISYELLNGAARFEAFKPCVKSYLSTQFRSRFLKIPYEQWDIALFLPLQRFQKAPQSHVWDESRSIVNGDTW